MKWNILSPLNITEQKVGKMCVCVCVLTFQQQEIFFKKHFWRESNGLNLTIQPVCFRSTSLHHLAPLGAVYSSRVRGCLFYLPARARCPASKAMLMSMSVFAESRSVRIGEEGCLAFGAEEDQLRGGSTSLKTTCRVLLSQAAPCWRLLAGYRVEQNALLSR